MQNITNNLYDKLSSGDSEGYINLKYQNFQEGDNVVFEGKDFKNLDLTNFALPFTIFKNCTLENVKVSGQPIGFKNSRASIDLRGLSGVIVAEDTDFTGTQFDKDTSFAASAFSNCKLDKEFEDFILSQGAVFTDVEVIKSRMGE